MVNASLNWASIVGIVLAVGGALLYFMRSFKPALARDYDVFFAAVGLLCGGILFFQGWRLDPILQFGQFLLAGTTVRRATLHNADEIARKDVRPGDTVWVEKAGEIIPAVVAVVPGRRAPGAAPYVFPRECPVCRTVAVRPEGEVAWKA